MTIIIRNKELVKEDKLSHLLYIPYSFWIKFALILNLQIVHKIIYQK